MIYAISDGESVKFGISQNPLSRMKELQTGNPATLRLIASCGKVSLAEPVAEALIHAVCRRSWLRGEWFTYAGRANEVAAFISAQSIAPMYHSLTNFLVDCVEEETTLPEAGIGRLAMVERWAWQNKPRQ